MIFTVLSRQESRTSGCFSLDHQHDEALTAASEKVLGSIGDIVTTNI